MVSKSNRIIQTVRDAVLLVLSIVLISTDIGPGREAANYLLAGVSAIILVLTIANVIALNVLKVKGKGYFYVNSFLQLFLSIPMLMLPPLGVGLIIINLAILITLREKKPKGQ